MDLPSKDFSKLDIQKLIESGKCIRKIRIFLRIGFISEIENKAESVKGIVKTGRTHLMDAMPVDFSDELKAWSSQLTASRKMLEVIEERFLDMPQ